MMTGTRTKEVSFAQAATKEVSKRDVFSSNFAFVLTTAGSAIGLGNIWKFPYMVGKFDGGTFLLVYLIFLLFVGVPAFLSEILIGKITQKRPDDAFYELGKRPAWKRAGLFTIWTGFIVSSFYSVVAGWILGYFFEALLGRLTSIHTTSEAHAYYTTLMESPYWAVGYHALFAAFCGWFLYHGVRKGLEHCNRIFMPIFFLIILCLVGWAATLPTSGQVIAFFGQVDIAKITPALTMAALGHAFFTLSVGQGTLVTYGSYSVGKRAILGSSSVVVIADTCVSLFSAFIILSTTIFAGAAISFGPGLIFETLPTIFSTLPGGHLLSLLFFFLVFIAALTSQISALEPLISHAEEKWRYSRQAATCLVVIASFALGIPAALSTSLFPWTLMGQNFLDLTSFAATSLFIPLGGLFAVLLIGRKIGVASLLTHMHPEDVHYLQKHRPLFYYLRLSMSYVAPALILIVLLHALISF